MDNQLPDEFHFLSTSLDDVHTSEINSNAFRQYARLFIQTISQALTTMRMPVEYRDIMQWGMRIDKLFWIYCEHHMESDKTTQRLKDTFLDRWPSTRDEVRRKFKRDDINRKDVTIFYMGLYRAAGINDPLGEALRSYLDMDRCFLEKLTTYVFGESSFYYA